MDNEKIISLTKAAIVESGNPFNKIPTDSILKFLANNGISDANTRKSIYKTLSEHYSSIDTKSATTDIKVDKQVQEKQPRRSVFGEIKRVA